MQLIRAHALFTLAMAHFQVEDDERVAQVLHRIGPIDTPKEQESAEAVRLLRCAIALTRALALARIGKGDALQAISAIGPADLELLPVDIRGVFFETLHNLIALSPLEQLSSSWVLEILKATEDKFHDHRDWALRLANALGARAHAERLEMDRVRSFFPATAFGKLLDLFARATYLAEDRNSDDAIREAENALGLCHELGIKEGEGFAQLHVVKADAAYQREDLDLAEQEYRKAIGLAPTESFARGWGAWRVGIILEDEGMLQTAQETLQKAGYLGLAARAQGARGAVLLKNKRLLEGIKCIELLTRAYFSEGSKDCGPSVTIAHAHLVRLVSELEGQPIPDTDFRFPQFGPGAYAGVLSTTQPRVGPVVAYYNLARAYAALGETAAAQSCLSTSISFRPEIAGDLNALPLVIKQRLDGLDGAQDESEISRCVDLMLSCQEMGTSSPLPFLSHCLFDKADTDAKDGKELQKMKVILDRLEVAGRQKPDDFWKAAVLIRRAKLLRLERGNTAETVSVFRQALKVARAGKNSGAMIDAAHVLSFQLETHSRSMKELAASQLTLVEGVELQNSDFDRLIIHGRNLYNLWKTIDFRRLSETDLPAKKYLFDSAKALAQSSIQSDQKAIVMLLLLFKLFNHEGPALAWARSHIKVQLSDLPEQIGHLLDNTVRLGGSSS